MRSALLASLLLCLAATGAAAQAPEAPPPGLPAAEDVALDPAAAPAGGYSLDPRHASVIWRVRHTGVGVFVGRFDRVSATLDFNPAAPESSALTATADTASVSTGVRNGAGELAFDGEIAAVLGAPAEISFRSTSAVRTGPAQGLVTGDLTLNGRTRPAVFEVTFHGGRFVQLRGKHVLAFAARTVIDRRDWGVGSFVFNRFAGDAVEILIEAEFVKD